METPYLSALSADAQVNRGAIRYEYRISVDFTRKHCNPPLWLDLHEHRFTVGLELSAVRPETGLFGLDMCAVEQTLGAWAQALPPVINDSRECPHGTTEELCHYFARMPVPSHIRLLSIAIAEVPQRVTVLRFDA